MACISSPAPHEARISPSGPPPADIDGLADACDAFMHVSLGCVRKRRGPRGLSGVIGLSACMCPDHAGDAASPSPLKHRASYEVYGRNACLVSPGRLPMAPPKWGPAAALSGQTRYRDKWKERIFKTFVYAHHIAFLRWTKVEPTSGPEKSLAVRGVPGERLRP